MPARRRSSRSRSRRKEARRQQAEARGEKHPAGDDQRRGVRVDARGDRAPDLHRPAHRRAAGPAAQPYYGVRKLVERNYGLEITQAYFRDLLIDWQREHGPIPGLYYDPRGKLFEPHTGKTVEVGTREVADYTFPDFVYDKILYIEKKGANVAFEALKLKERFDLAILSGEGQPAEAARALFARAEAGDYRLFVLHDGRPRRLQHRPDARRSDGADARSSRRGHRPRVDRGRGGRS